MSCFFIVTFQKELDIVAYSEINSLVLTQPRKHEESFTLHKTQAVDR